MKELVRFANVSKSFGQVKVLTDCSFAVNSGEVVALMGENGAGKSTLMKILSGIWPAGDYEGKVFIEGQQISFKTPLEAEKAGVAIIHQELSFFSHLTVGENIFVGHWPNSIGQISWKNVHFEANKWLNYVGAHCSTHELMSEQSVGTQQLVEIAKALSRESKILVLDEPTSALSPKEVEKLFALMRQLKSEGRALIYISHKMEEIFKIADRIVVLRDGCIVGDKKTSEWTQDDLIRVMVGRELTSLFPKRNPKITDETVLSVKKLEISRGGKKLIGPVSFDVKKGEIFGIGGLLGSGRTELLKALYGSQEFTLKGDVQVKGKIWAPKAPRKSLSGQVVYLSEDRKRESVLKKRSIHENLRIAESTLKFLFMPINETKEYSATENRLKTLRVKYHETEQDILSLSGGNQQKVILGRILEVSPDLIMLDEPTRGVDVGAKYEIYQILFELAEMGRSLLVVSSELPELLGLCDRVLVLREGQDMGVLQRKEFSPEAVMSRAFGVNQNSQNTSFGVSQ